MKYLIESQGLNGERLYMRRKNRYGSWTYWRPDALRFDSRWEAKGALSDRRPEPGFRFVVRADQNMDFTVFPPKVVSRIRPALMKRGERRWKERMARV